MKAYMVTDRKGYSDYSVIVFAETPGKAVTAALGTDEFPYHDWDFTELKALRRPALDSAYRGCDFMDWDNATDRIAMVKEAGFTCDPDSVTLAECNTCPAREWCSEYEYLMEEAEEDLE